MSHNQKLLGKHVLVTGAAQGIGEAISLKFAEEGAAVIAADRNKAVVQKYSNIEGVTGIELDVSDVQSVELCQQAHPNIDILVNCAGIVHGGTVLDCSEGDFLESMKVNVGSMYYTIRTFLPSMLEKKSGVIINIASAVAASRTTVNRFAYATSKGAVVALTKSVALDFIGRGITCNSISPGTINTPSLEGRIVAAGNSDKARAAFVARQPMGRLGPAEDVASVALLMASGEAGFMSGSDVVIDGGFSL